MHTCNIYCFSTTTVIRQSASVLRYAYIVCLVHFDKCCDPRCNLWSLSCHVQPPRSFVFASEWRLMQTNLCCTFTSLWPPDSGVSHKGIPLVMAMVIIAEGGRGRGSICYVPYGTCSSVCILVSVYLLRSTCRPRCQAQSKYSFLALVQFVPQLNNSDLFRTACTNPKGVDWSLPVTERCRNTSRRSCQG